MMVVDKHFIIIEENKKGFLCLRSEKGMNMNREMEESTFIFRYQKKEKKSNTFKVENGMSWLDGNTKN
jgi:hypothetical protein